MNNPNDPKKDTQPSQPGKTSPGHEEKIIQPAQPTAPPDTKKADPKH